MNSPAKTAAPRRDGVNDERGAIMVMAVFFAVFLVALLFSVVGTAQAIFIREHLQDSTDGAVLSGAILNAQAMNLIVLANIVMASLLAILVALKAIEALCIIAIAICAALAYVTAGASLSAIPALNQIRSTTSDIHAELKDPIFTAIETLHDVSDNLKTFAPEFAKQGAEERLLRAGEDPAHDAMVYAKVTTLPVEDDKYNVLCDKAGTAVCKVVLLPFGESSVTDTISSACGKISKGLAQWFCDDSANGDVDFPVKNEQEVLYPRTTESRKCEKDGDDKSCQWVQDAEPNSKGFCMKETQCDKAENGDDYCRKADSCGAYEAYVAAARDQCDPVKQSFQKYAYQVHSARVVYVYSGKKRAWVRGTPTNHEYSRVQGAKRPPCSSDDKKRPSIGVGYEMAVHPRGNTNAVLPVCSNEAPPAVTRKTADGDTVTVEFKECTQILGCTRTETYEVPIEKDDDTNKGDKDDRSPKKVTDKLKLGDETFILRAIGARGPSDTAAGKLVKLALWGHEESNGFTRMKWLSKYSFAEAEYFYNGSAEEDRESWMWNMKWKARLRRFTAFSDAEDMVKMVTVCTDKVSADCWRLSAEFFVTGLAAH